MTDRRLGVAAAYVDGHLVPGDVRLDGATVVAVGVSPAGRSGLAVPGFIDLQINGCGGVDFTATDLDGYRTACGMLARHGVTSFLATLPTSHSSSYGPALAAAGDAMAEAPPGARVRGVHLEGPFLAPERHGAHRQDRLQAADRDRLDQLLVGDHVTMITLAPEIDGGLDLVRFARARGLVVALGHTDASADVAHRAFDAGASAVTHLWNAHRPVTARDPGVGGVALARPDVIVCVIADLAHVSPEVLSFTAAAARGRLAAVSDALAPAGITTADSAASDAVDTSPSDDAHGPESASDDTGGWSGLDTVWVSDGAVRHVDGSLAGAACLLDIGLVNLVSIGVGLPEALDAVSGAPARLLGRPDLGRLTVGGTADVVVLDDRYTVDTVFVGGVRVT